MELSRIHRHRYIIEDPARFGCLLSAAALLFVDNVPFWMTMCIVGVTQLGPVMMAARALDQGWSRRWGSKVHASVYASNLSMDFTSLSACTVIGALLLARHYGSAEVVKPLAVLTLAICFLPDVRICRFLLSGDPVEASRQLRQGSIFRDPVMLGAILATGVASAVDRVSLNYFLASLAFLQFNALLVLVDKYLPEIESTFKSSWKALVFDREGRRLWLTLAPLALVPARVVLGDRIAWGFAGLIVLTIVLPEIYRLVHGMISAVGNLFKVTPSQGPATYIVLPK
jgi:hypothetical protein